MDLRRAWSLSKTPYVELVFESSRLVGGVGRSDDHDAQKRVKSALRGAKVNKAMFSLFGCLGAAIPFAVAPAPLSLASAVALSLLVAFAYVVLYTIQVLPSFSRGDAFSLLLTMPFNEKDYSLVATFSFLRTFDYLAAGSVVVPAVAVAILTGSLPASALMLAASAMNVTLAVFVGLLISRVFYRSITRGGRSRVASVFRTLFIVAWGFAVLSVGFAFQIATSFLPLLNQFLAGGISQSFGMLFLALHPFSLGFAVSSLAYPAYFASGAPVAGGASLVPLSYVSALGYSMLAILAAFGTARTVSNMSHGRGGEISREIASNYTLKLHGPLYAYALKDIRMASKNPSTAFLFVFPTFGALVFLIAISETGVLAVLDVLLLTLIASGFALAGALLLLNLETRALNYSLILPVSKGLITESKALTSTLTFLPVPFVLLLVQLVFSGGPAIASLVPFVEILAVGAATIAEISLFIGGGARAEGGVRSTRGEGDAAPLVASGVSFVSGSDLGRVIKALAIALPLVLAPLASFLVTFLLGYSDSISILGMAAVAVLEVVLAHLARGSVRSSASTGRRSVWRF